MTAAPTRSTGSRLNCCLARLGIRHGVQHSVRCEDIPVTIRVSEHSGASQMHSRKVYLTLAHRQSGARRRRSGNARPALRPDPARCLPNAAGTMAAGLPPWPPCSLGARRPARSRRCSPLAEPCRLTLLTTESARAGFLPAPPSIK
jgi:hypothetical protein